MTKHQTIEFPYLTTSLVAVCSLAGVALFSREGARLVEFSDLAWQGLPMPKLALACIERLESEKGNIVNLEV